MCPLLKNPTSGPCAPKVWGKKPAFELKEDSIELHEFGYGKRVVII